METVTLGSKLTFQETNDFVSLIQKKLNNAPPSLRVDMKGCHYLNSIMLSGLIRALKLCEKQGCAMVLTNINTSAKTLLETTNVDSLFNMDAGPALEPAHSLLELQFEKSETGHGVVKMKGSLNTPVECTQFRGFYESHFNGIKHGILCCDDLFHLSSSGVTEMFRLRGLLHEKKGQLILISRSDSVDSVWKMMHLESLIPRAQNIEQAQELLSAGG